MPNVIRHLINDNGEPFNSTELQTISGDLDRLTDIERTNYRNGNASAIAGHPSVKIVIVSGPGTGKSTIFKQRIDYWLTQNPSAGILALSFVRKLVADLQNDIQNDTSLTEDQKGQVEVHTLHKYARSIVEQNHGTPEIRFQPHFRIISDVWTDAVWEDVLLTVDQPDKTTYSFKKFNEQLHNSNFNTSEEWEIVIYNYFKLSKFYNAVGFADLIFHAPKALLENRSLIKHQFYIIDEYQDFNTAEENFINELTIGNSGVLIVGDDDQVLYEKLKSGKAELIRNLYQDTSFTSAMLPFCGRSSFHITKTASHFIKQSQEDGCIEKVYLPISTDTQCPKVQIIGCATSPTAVDYIKKFIEDHAQEIATRKNDLISGQSKDPFLLILTPAGQVTFYANSNANKDLFEMVAEYKEEPKKFSEDYYKLLTYYSLARHPENNFTFRKVFYYEGTATTDISVLINECLTSSKQFFELAHESVQLILSKCQKVKEIIESTDSIEVKIQKLSVEIGITNSDELRNNLTEQAIDENQVLQTEHKEEESVELEELEVKNMCAVELLTLVGSKGLSADHVMIIGFDNQNMSWITKNAFFVAITRARKSLHLITALGSGGSQRPHAYLDMLPSENIEFYKYKKSNRQIQLLRDKSEFIQYLESLQQARNNSRRPN